MDIVEHPLKPFIPEGAKLLVLGSFPPPRVRWSMDFYYPNFINDFWRICGIVFFSDKDYFIAEDKGKKLKKFDRERIVEFCREKGIALYDTASAVRRLKGNASDKFLEVARPTDIASLLAQMPGCKAIAVTGQKALETFIDANRPLMASSTPELSKTDMKPLDIKDIKIGEPVAIKIPAGRELLLFRMPSTSRAYPLSLEKKAASYRRMFEAVLV